jgi:methylenetetrahydrofolate dehydrogenase (NADP+)/methenyltetrahydrofolate cyclohydrolase
MKDLYGGPVVERIEAEMDSIDVEQPTLAIYLIGDDPGSRIYARSKIKKGKKLGINAELRSFSSDAPLQEVVTELKMDRDSDEVTGIMIERPLPEAFDLASLMNLIPPEKDVEGVTPYNYGLMAQGRPSIIPPTPLGAMILTMHYGIETNGQEVAVLGRSVNVGKPLFLLLSSKSPYGNATVTQIHSRTESPGTHIGRADIVYSAVGSPGMIKGDMIKSGSVLIDLGISTKKNEKGIFGDVDRGSVEGVASAVTPTPGGTGPVTVASIFLNLLVSKMNQTGKFSQFEDGIIRNIYGIE